jgi:hypothetical protein
MRAIPLVARPSGVVAQIGSRAAAPPPGMLAAQALHQDLGDQDLVDQTQSRRLPMAISDAFVTEILKPYREHARYLKSAELTQFSEEAVRDSASKESLVTGVGRFSIPESCYIDDTGHFNAVEFNICYNQLAYVVFGKCVEAGLMHQLWQGSVDMDSFSSKIPSYNDYKRHQLPAMLIVRVDDVRFFKPMKSDDFRAELKVERMTLLGQAGFFFTSITFSDSEGVKAKGSVVLAFQPNLTKSKD